MNGVQMAQLSCPNCASPVEPSPAELRARVAFCPSCSTPSRISDQGLVSAVVFAEQEEPPEDMWFEKTADGAMRVGIPKYPRIFMLLPRDTIVLLVASLILAGAIGESGLFVVGFMVGALVLGLVRKQLPVLVASAEEIRPAIPAVFLPAGPVPVSGIVQLYVVAKKLQVGGQDLSEEFGVWALFQDGGRRPVALGIRALEYALYLEGLLETHLAIADRAVYGSASRQDVIPRSPGELRPAAPAPVSERFGCGSCGADVVLGARELLRGTARCNFCNSITLTVPLDADGEVLGQPDDPSRFRELSVRDESGVLLVRQAAGDRLLLEVARGRISTAEGSHPVEALTRFYVLPDKLEEAVGLDFWSNLIGSAPQWAFSGDFDYVGPDGGGFTGPFTLYAEDRSGRLVVLVKGLQDPWEAAALRRVLARRGQLPE